MRNCQTIRQHFCQVTRMNRARLECWIHDESRHAWQLSVKSSSSRPTAQSDQNVPINDTLKEEGGLAVHQPRSDQPKFRPWSRSFQRLAIGAEASPFSEAPGGYSSVDHCWIDGGLLVLQTVKSRARLVRNLSDIHNIARTAKAPSFKTEEEKPVH